MRRTTSVDTCVNNLLYMRASFYWRKSGTALARFCGVTGVGNGDTISKDCGLEPEPDIFITSGSIIIFQRRGKFRVDTMY